MQKPLLVISFDGFKRSYIDSNIVKTLKRMAECGTTAEVGCIFNFQKKKILLIELINYL